MSTFQQTMFIIACVATFLLVLQILMMLIGGSNDADAIGGGLTDGGDGFDLADGADGDFSGDIPSMLDGGGFVGDSGANDGAPDVSHVVVSLCPLVLCCDENIFAICIASTVPNSQTINIQ